MDLKRSRDFILLSETDLEKVSGGNDDLSKDQMVTYGICSFAALVSCVGFIATITGTLTKFAKDNASAFKGFVSSLSSGS